MALISAIKTLYAESVGVFPSSCAAQTFTCLELLESHLICAEYYCAYLACVSLQQPPQPSPSRMTASSRMASLSKYFLEGGIIFSHKFCGWVQFPFKESLFDCG